MKYENVKIGMKVFVYSKSTGSSLFNSKVYQQSRYMKQEYLYVISKKEKNDIVLNCDIDNSTGDYFLASDFEPYLKYERKKNLKNYV